MAWLACGLDRSRAWDVGGSVRYLVAELSARDGCTPRRDLRHEPGTGDRRLGSMAGAKIDAARRAARAVVGLNLRDRLSIVPFDSRPEFCWMRPMDEAGRAAAAVIAGLVDRGGRDLFDGWLWPLARGIGLATAPRASHRVVLLSDGQANEGLTDRKEIAGHVGAGTRGSSPPLSASAIATMRVAGGHRRGGRRNLHDAAGTRDRRSGAGELQSSVPRCLTRHAARHRACQPSG